MSSGLYGSYFLRLLEKAIRYTIEAKIHYYHVRSNRKQFYIFLVAILLNSTYASYRKKLMIIIKTKKKNTLLGILFGISRDTPHLYNRYHTVTVAIFTLKLNPFRKTRRWCGETHLPDNQKNVDSYSTSGYTVLVRSRVGESGPRCRDRYVYVYIYIMPLSIHVFFFVLFLFFECTRFVDFFAFSFGNVIVPSCRLFYRCLRRARTRCTLTLFLYYSSSTKNQPKGQTAI